ncbi:MAG: glycosyltransferase [Comamonadaceae bacterium]|nr:MAG: glycosyltransferase [Comamonadaceae bacterium]
MTAGPQAPATPPLSVSVALCTWNGARFVREQVRSICLQTRPPQEIVLSDDASTDDCVAVARAALQECLSERPGLEITLRVLANPVALRVTKNFEQAVRACSGALIALSDQDDLWLPDRLAMIVAQFEQRPDLLLLHTDARLVDAGGAPLGDTLFHALEVQPNELA